MGVCAPGQTNQAACGGNCGMDTQTCSASGTWQDGACMQGACAPDATQSCNTYGTQTCDASCAWSACSCPSASVCTPAATQCSATSDAAETCDTCGQWESVACVKQTCVAAVCTGVCAPGQTNPLTCAGNCGVDTQTCTASGTWLDGTCVQGACAPNATQTCDTYGTQTCQSTCTWGACSCPLAPVCTPVATQCSGNAAQTCSACGQWVGGACVNQTCVSPGACTGVCAPAQTDPVACGNCGTDTQTCTASGAWKTSGTCAGQGVCAPNATQTCNTNGTQTCTAGCAWGVCSCPATPPVCTPGALQCTSGITAQTCNTCGQWVTTTCTTAQQCVGGACLPITSCAPGGTGLTSCGASSESCCTSLELPGGTYDRTYNSFGGSVSGQADPASVSGFRLDKYLVTVGRFRQFVSAWNGGAGFMPAAGSGKHVHLNGGQGLANSGSPGTYEPGWVISDNANVAPTGTNLACAFGEGNTWTPSAGTSETLPMNCVNSWEAIAFCIWDGGFLPSEAEWEYAAAGGSQLRQYPWGSTDPGSANQYAIYNCDYPSPGDASAGCPSTTFIAPVGTATLGAGLWGQLDMGGEENEWVLDWYTFPPKYVDPCIDCTYLTATSQNRSMRGGYWAWPNGNLLSSNRNGFAQMNGQNRNPFVGGFRCARVP